MNTLTQSLSWFFVALAIASIVGVFSYSFFRWACEKSTQVFLFFTAFIAIFGGIVGLLFFTYRYSIVGGSSILWILATYADRAAYPSDETWFETFFKLAITTVCSTFSGYVFLQFIDKQFSWSLMSDTEVAYFYTGYLIGGLLMPSVISISLWIWKSSKLRPGIDRHLNSDDEPM